MDIKQRIEAVSKPLSIPQEALDKFTELVEAAIERFSPDAYNLAISNFDELIFMWYDPYGTRHIIVDEGGDFQLFHLVTKSSRVSVFKSGKPVDLDFFED